MAAPWKDPNSGVWYLRQKTPRDLLVRLRGTSLTLPVGEGPEAKVAVGEIVKVSLRTKDDRVARTRHAVANAFLQKHWDDARSPEAILAGEKSIGVTGKNEPSGAAGGMSWDEAVRRFGPGCDELLVELGQAPTEAHRAAVISGTASIMDEAFATLRKQKLGDSTPPSVPRATVPVGQHQGHPTRKTSADPITVSELWERYRAKKTATLAANTLHRYGASIARFAAFMATREVRSITDDDVYAWAEHRRDVEKIAPRTVNGNDLAAVSSLFVWAQGRDGDKLLKENPAKGVSLAVGRQKRLREKNFRDLEITAILRAARDITAAGPRDSNQQAKRWCPWLAAYSGARISELTALKAEDIRREQGAWIMFFDETKNSEARSVPIHAHVIEQGFLDFVRAVGSGPLFYDPAKHDPKARTPAWEVRSRKLAEWVRKAVKLDAAVDPNHGWRHTFKTRAVRDMPDRIRDEIVGHAPGSVPRHYERPSITMMAEALVGFPRYDI